jgi:5-methylthioadenosine/S-adenosylhomocysteine deaminase
MPATTRYSAAWLLPVCAPPIADGALLCDDTGRIVAAGPAATVPTPPGARSIDLGEAALLPGLVNTHAHPELAAFRGLLDDLPFEEWIITLNAAKRGAVLPAEAWTDAARWTCVEALAAGITTMGATEASGAALEAFAEAGMRGIVYREVFGPDPAVARAALAELRDAVSRLRLRETELVRVGVSPHAPYTVSDELFRGTAELALAEGYPLAVHAAEAEVERQLVRDGTGRFAAGLRRRGIETPPRGRSTIALLERTGVLAARPLIHCVRVDAEDMRLIADRGATVAHCPVANAILGHGIAPVMEMRAAGIALGLGTDSVASNNRLDLLEEARAAQLFQRVRLQSAGELSNADALRLATLDGARALGLEARVGTLEPGKDADLCAVSLAGAHVLPVHDPVAALVHSARASDVVLTAVRGEILYRDGRVLSLDAAALRGRVLAVAEALHRARDEWRARGAPPPFAARPATPGGSEA